MKYLVFKQVFRGKKNQNNKKTTATYFVHMNSLSL